MRNEIFSRRVLLNQAITAAALIPAFVLTRQAIGAAEMVGGRCRRAKVRRAVEDPQPLGRVGRLREDQEQVVATLDHPGPLGLRERARQRVHVRCRTSTSILLGPDSCFVTDIAESLLYASASSTSAPSATSRT